VRYLVHADGDPSPAEGESQDVRWFGWDEAIAMADPGLRGFLVHWRSTMTMSAPETLEGQS
jgi:hypothetical protein